MFEFKLEFHHMLKLWLFEVFMEQDVAYKWIRAAHE